jgi:hypothetical protein
MEVEETREGRRFRGNVICKRCGQPGYVVRERRGSRFYYYMYHESSDGDRVKCYLGPVDPYVAGSVTHSDLGLYWRGLVDDNRDVEYLKTLLDHFLGLLENEKTRGKVASKLRRLVPDLLKLLKMVTRVKVDVEEQPLQEGSQPMAVHEREDIRVHRDSAHIRRKTL